MPLLPSPPLRSNIVALGFLVKFQKHLSLRVLVLQPLVITLVVLLSTAALVGGAGGRMAHGQGWGGGEERRGDGLVGAEGGKAGGGGRGEAAGVQSAGHGGRVGRQAQGQVHEPGLGW